jgi:hypothetical protein
MDQSVEGLSYGLDEGGDGSICGRVKACKSVVGHTELRFCERWVPYTGVNTAGA